MRSPFLVAALLVFSGCTEPAPPTERASSESENGAAAPQVFSNVAENPNRNAYFGDLHVHTQFSMDAYLFGSRATPDDAYAFAKGGALKHSAGSVMQMKKPLDFLAVTDHGVYLGVVKAMVEAESGPLAEHALRERFRKIVTPADSRAAFTALAEYGVPTLAKETKEIAEIPKVSANAWQAIVDAAERHNAPGEFTSFVGYEYTTSGPNTENLHRNVIFRGADVPELPFSAFDSPYPEDLWDWMDGQRALGRELLAIPHNPNGSDGLMFDLVKSDGSPMDADYAALRMRNEPLVEQTQVKGTSDTHPLLSPNDEWADFEIMPIMVGSPKASKPEGSYVRQALQRGLEFAESQGFNPYKFGLIGSSDTHNAAGSFEEDNYWSKTSITDITPAQRGSVPLSGDSEVVKNDPLASGEASGVAPDERVYATAAARYWGASGLAGVWAESNTRAAIYAAFQRKETFSTSGPHIPVRFFASLEFEDALLDAQNPIEVAYRRGVPMGGELPGDAESSPRFFAWAAQDPDTVGLQRLQVIKGWIEDGVSHEQVYDIACSDGGSVNPATHRCPDNAATVNLATCAVSEGKGAGELSALWQDPDFDPEERAFYYVRVLENPTCRWSTWDAIRAGVAPRVDMQPVIQERAWSSPIWYRPT